MAEKDRAEDGPSLELPSFFGRRKRRTREPEAPTAEPEAGSEDTLVIDTEPLVAAEPEPAPQSEPEPAPEPEPRVAVAEPEPEPAPARPAPPVAVAEPTPEPAPRVERHRPEPAPEPEPQPEPRPVEREPKAPVGERLQASLPDLAVSTAALVVGALVGLVGCGATWAALQGCELATGTDSCGGPGLLVLIVIVVGMILLGAALLRIFGVPEPGNVSFLGVAIMVAVALVFLISYLFEPWMFVAIPVLTSVSYWLARWITTRWTDPGDEETITHDVR